MDFAIREKAEQWLQSNIDQDAKAEIQKMLNDENGTELTDAFYKDLEFGTGGLRGIMGIGSNRINKYTIGKATQGLSNYLKKAFPDEQIKVAIAYDSRNKSDAFARISAAVFSANGIKVYFCRALRPTPLLSFAIRYYGCHSGVVQTASHNPKEYNGYKAYWNDGAQVVPPHDTNIIAEVEAITDFSQIRFEANENLIEWVGEELDNAYLDQVKTLFLSPEAVKKNADIKIVFSSLHGTGITLVPEMLKRMGFNNVVLVDEQSTPDGNFPTVVYPNPEETEAMTLALKKAASIDADLVMATDPDADRVGIGVKNEKGDFQLLNGNQTGALITWYMLRRWKELGRLNGNQYIVNTVVTTDLILDIARHYNVEYYSTLTGFKYIADIIRANEGKKQYITGGEESYGYLPGDFVRDKDAIASCAVIAEMAAWALDQGMTLFNMMLEMYKEFGLYKEGLISITKKGKSGAEEIQEMMLELRANPPATIDGSAVVKLIDYKESIEKNLIEGTSKSIDYPISNVLQFLTEDGSKISARPSGTEPKIKFYFSVKGKLTSREEYRKAEADLDDKIQRIIDELKLK
ncbi:MAG: phospho-sugar mutase [Cyclobacteriaceae bacterium]|nr:phospho-sugar mutase [Cyclobacteriaceae bacterium]